VLRNAKLADRTTAPLITGIKASSPGPSVAQVAAVPGAGGGIVDLAGGVEK
jgi:hypothetical protein